VLVIDTLAAQYIGVTMLEQLEKLMENVALEYFSNAESNDAAEVAYTPILKRDPEEIFPDFDHVTVF
jgi:hypothetical protein